MPHIKLDGTNFYYQQAGQGPDVVLVHAVTSNQAVWMFINIVDVLAEEFRVTVYDLRGHGLTEASPTGYTSADMARDLKQLHQALGLGPAFLVGHSYGGVIAMHAAVLYPDIVAGVILSDSYFPGLRHLEPNMGQADVWLELRDGFSSAGVDIGDAVDFERLFRVVETLTKEQLEKVKTSMGPASSRWLAQLPRLAATTCGADIMAEAGLTAARLASIRQPVAALYDEHSPFLATSQFLKENLPDCRFEIIPGAKHIAPLQNPTAFVGAVRKHLRSFVEPVLIRSDPRTD